MIILRNKEFSNAATRMRNKPGKTLGVLAQSPDTRFTVREIASGEQKATNDFYKTISKGGLRSNDNLIKGDIQQSRWIAQRGLENAGAGKSRYQIQNLRQRNLKKLGLTRKQLENRAKNKLDAVRANAPVFQKSKLSTLAQGLLKRV
jgi:hypothetical protein